MAHILNPHLLSKLSSHKQMLVPDVESHHYTVDNNAPLEKQSVEDVLRRAITNQYVVQKLLTRLSQAVLH